MMDINKVVNRHILKPLWFKYKGNDYRFLLPKLSKLNNSPVKELRRYQLERVRDIIANAYKNVSFYREKWKTLGLNPIEIDSLE